MASGGKQGLIVVVWEWENKQRRWRPYPPEVTQQLERAFHKNLRSVFLGDSDPSLKNYFIILPQMEQECKISGERVKVRRNFYPQSSPAGQGAVWQWAGDVSGDWHTYDMCVQCVIEESWGTGAQTLDMRHSFPMCPYVINFCNLTQMNNKTGFIRAIRRVQQAAYPVGKPTFMANHLHHHTHGSNNSSSNSSYPFSSGNKMGAALATAGGSGPVASLSGEKLKRRSSRDEVEASTSDNTHKPRTIIDKVLGRGNNSSSSRSSPAPVDTSTGHPVGQLAGRCGGGSSAPPKPLPRSSVPPVPKPRTTLPPARQYSSQPSGDPQHFLEDCDQHRHNSTLSRESCGSKFGSNITLDSDCSSLMSGSRRPSVDTISTYLSQDSCVGDDEAGHGSSGSSSTHTLSHHHDSGGSTDPRVDQLIRVESDESMEDDDVFGEDQEVRDVMRGGAHHSSSSRAPSPLPHHTHLHHTSRSQQNHFVPISAAQSSSDLGLQVNGVKRKRTGERASQGHSLPGNGSHSTHDPHYHTYQNHHHHNNNNNHHCHHHQHHHCHHKHQQGSRAPIASEDQLLVQYTSVVVSPPDEMCSICMLNLREPSGYSEDDQGAAARAPQIPGVPNDGAVNLVLCGHQFHLACVREMAKNTPQFLECPNCKTLHGEKLGNQPPGNMTYNIVHRSLPGYLDCNAIKITYSINSGIQGPEHPHPGHPYRAVGFPRIAYVPNNDKGKKVLRLLQEAWRRRLVFTIGTSVTLGIEDCVTWNEIHHKTAWDNYNGHGYPDPHYLDNTLKELELHGITEATLV